MTSPALLPSATSAFHPRLRVPTCPQAQPDTLIDFSAEIPFHRPSRRHATPMNSLLRRLSPSRLDRTAFLQRLLAWLGVAALLALWLGGIHAAPSGLTPVSATEHTVALILVKVGVLLLLMAACLITAVLPRLRDTGLHPAWLLLIFIPVRPLSLILLLALLFIPSGAFTRAGRLA